MVLARYKGQCSFQEIADGLGIYITVGCLIIIVDNRLFSLYHELEFGIILLMCNNVLLLQGYDGNGFVFNSYPKRVSM